MHKFVLLIISIFVIAACAPTVTATQFPTVDSQSPEGEIRTLVKNFGERLQIVSLLAPDAADQIQEQYAAFVSEDLLAAWAADPSSAPGRLTSSPWPDRIEISAVELQPDGSYLVTGSVIEVTSAEEANGGVAAQYPVEITVSQVESQWFITAWVAGEYQ